MKLLFIIFTIFSFASAMEDQKNMSKEQLEVQLKQAQKTIADQKQVIEVQQSAFNLVWGLNYGNDFERACALADLKKIKMFEYIKNN